MNIGGKYFLVLSLALTQGYFLPMVSSAVIPNLVLVAAVHSALTDDLKTSLYLAVWGGFWLDVADSTTFGLRIAWFSLLVLVLWWTKRLGAKNNRLTFAFVNVAIASLVYNLYLWSVLVVDAGQLVGLWRFSRSWLLEALASSLLAFWGWGWLQSRWRGNA